MLQIARSDGMDTQTSAAETRDGDLRTQTVISDVKIPWTTNRTTWASVQHSMCVNYKQTTTNNSDCLDNKTRAGPIVWRLDSILV